MGINSYSKEKMICPNCAKKLIGLKNNKGESKLECNRCGVKVFSKTITPSKKILEVTKQNKDID